MKARKYVLALIVFLSICLFSSAKEYNLLAFEPIGLFNKTFSGYYSKITPEIGTQITFPLKYQEKTDANSLSIGVEYRKYLALDIRGFYFETNGYVMLHDQKGPDIFTLEPSIVIGYKVDTNQGLFVEPELEFSLPLIASSGSALEISENIYSIFRVVLGLNNVYSNSVFFAPRLIFSYDNDTLEASGLLYLGYGF